MNSKKTICIILAVLILLVTAATIWHLSTRDEIPTGSIQLTQGSNTRYLTTTDLAQTQVTGTTINGKGETREIDAMGVALCSLAEGSYSKITVTSSDAYYAEVTPVDEKNAFLIVTEDDTVRLIVFGDENSKRDVKNVVHIHIET